MRRIAPETERSDVFPNHRAAVREALVQRERLFVRRDWPVFQAAARPDWHFEQYSGEI